jgi:rhodanese-related sulfurtransferase
LGRCRKVDGLAGVKRKTINDLLRESRSSLRRLEAREAFEAMRAGALLIDTRSTDQIDEYGSIPGSARFPLSVLEWRMDPASAHRDPTVGGFDRRIILICAHGNSSSLAARRLQELGFENATDVIGGFEAWTKAGLPVEYSHDPAPP